MEVALLNEYVSIVQSVESRPLKTIEEYAEDYRQHVLRRHDGTPAAGTVPKKKKVISSKYLNAAAGYGARRASAVHPTTEVPAAAPQATGGLEAPGELADDVARSQRRMSLTHNPQPRPRTNSTANWEQRLYNESIEKRDAREYLQAIAKEEAQRAAAEEERHVMEESSVHRAASKPTDATFARLYISGKGKEKWREQQRASQEAALTQSKPSPTRRRSMDRSSSETRRDVFQHLYDKRPQPSNSSGTGSAKRSVSPKESQPPQPNNITPRNHNNSVNRLDLSERHMGPQVHRTPVMTSSRREKLHQRLFEEAAERQNNLAMMQTLHKTEAEEEAECTFQPDLTQARREVARRSSSAHMLRRTSIEVGVGPDGSPLRQRSPTREPQSSQRVDEPTLTSSPKVNPPEVLEEDKEDPLENVEQLPPPPLPAAAPLDPEESAVLRALARRRTLESSRPSSPAPSPQTATQPEDLQLASFAVMHTSSQSTGKAAAGNTTKPQQGNKDEASKPTASGKRTVSASSQMKSTAAKPQLVQSKPAVAASLPSSTNSLNSSKRRSTPPPASQSKQNGPSKKGSKYLDEPIEDVFASTPKPSTSSAAATAGGHQQGAAAHPVVATAETKSPAASPTPPPLPPAASTVAKPKHSTKNSDSDSSDEEALAQSTALMTTSTASLVPPPSTTATHSNIPSPSSQAAAGQFAPSASSRTAAVVSPQPEVEELRQSISQQKTRRELMLQSLALLDSDDDSEA